MESNVRSRYRKLLVTIVCAPLIAGITACSHHKVDTMAKWCERIAEVDLERKYAPFWAVSFAVSFNGDAIRDDFASMINSAYLEKTQNRAPRMAWRQGTELHIVNLSALIMVPPEEFISDWRKGIATEISGKHADPADACLYGTVASAFDSLHVHTLKLDGLGNVRSEEVEVMHMDRERRIGPNRI